MNAATQISLTTVRLECNGPNASSVGTGYLYLYVFGDDIFPVIVTNKHVVLGATTLKTEFHVIKQGTFVGEDGDAENEEKFPVVINDLDSVTFHHPDDSIDLCVILLGTVLNSIKKGYGVKNVFISQGWLVDQELAPIIRPIETVVMVGYPSGIWDQVNNRPITRRGLTASHPLKSWNGLRQFVIDAACYPGSSGSPVFLFEDGLYRDKEGAYTPGTRVKLLGTLWGGPMVNAHGQMVDVEVPVSVLSNSERAQVPVVQVMMNLGYVIHAETLNDFEPMIKTFMLRYKAN
ncbi:trypsin-like peptidase domain-containing protein [Pseudomonas mediterranea]|uniref:trypsin-like peptidase domain-containing protein n=1 Tax=Pseudomonas mediterranea TaxID=183795 RepID=UPI0009E9DF3F|nr:trypsin-like peptidase domain-containing protein [Pseudomonas mediterranea]